MGEIPTASQFRNNTREILKKEIIGKIKNASNNGDNFVKINVTKRFGCKDSDQIKQKLPNFSKILKELKHKGYIIEYYDLFYGSMLGDQCMVKIKW